MTNRGPGQSRSTLIRCLAILALCTVLVPLAAVPLQAAHAATFTITLTPSQPSGVAAGTPVRWTASSTDPNPLVYQFTTQYSLGHFQTAPRMVRDFSPKPSFQWVPQEEGLYTITVAVKEIVSSTVPYGVGYGHAAIATASVGYTVTTTATTGDVITPTSNPLVAALRAPACPVAASGDNILAQFRALGTTAWTNTNSTPCQGLSSPFYIAGMLPNTTYQMRHVIVTPAGTVVSVSPIQTFQTGTLPSNLFFPQASAPVPPTAQSDTTAGILDYMIANLTIPNEAVPLATNLAGQVIWFGYQSDLYPVWSLRDQLGTTFIAGNDGTQPQTGGLNVLRVVDLAGNSLQETNIGAVNDELMARYGTSVHLVNGFHHDALALPNGDLAVLAFTTATITTTPILSDNILVFDQNMQVVWAWDAFNYLNPNRGPTLGDICGNQSNGVLCPGPTGPLPSNTIDWLHSNALAWSPSDNNIVLSMRSQDWADKLYYNNGAGDGHIVWTLGKGGSFILAGAARTQPYPWFSHQHNVNYLDNNTLAVFDNGNTRCFGAAAGTCDSRGQEYLLNEPSIIVTQTLNLDLGEYSPALGTAQRLSNGNFNFDLGLLGTSPNQYSQGIEVQRSGTQAFVSQLQQASYRIWRLQTLYATTNPACPTCTPGH